MAKQKMCDVYTPCEHNCVKCRQKECFCAGGDGRYKRCVQECNRFGMSLKTEKEMMTDLRVLREELGLTPSQMRVMVGKATREEEVEALKAERSASPSLFLEWTFHTTLEFKPNGEGGYTHVSDDREIRLFRSGTQYYCAICKIETNHTGTSSTSFQAALEDLMAKLCEIRDGLTLVIGD
jgi:hypothetical protein